MNNQQIYLKNRERIGWGLLILGVVLFAAGLVLQTRFVLPFNARIISALGIFFAGLGLGQVLRYWSVQRNHQAAARLVNEERDERNRQIRAQAGYRAFWLSLVMTYTGLMWISFASNGSLPVVTPDGQWFYLAAAFVLPFSVYIGSIVIDQVKS